jgi:hypothetical protein
MTKQILKSPGSHSHWEEKRDMAEFMHLLGLDDERHLVYLRSLSVLGQAQPQRHVQYSVKFTADST